MRNLSQAILDSISDHIAVINNEGIIIAVNKSWIRFSNENNGDLYNSYINTNYLDVCQNEVREGLELVLKGNSPQFSYEYPCHDHQNLRWFLLKASPIVLDKNYFGAVICHINITDRKIAELKLAEKEERYRLITENSTDFISIHTISGVFTFASPICESILGYHQAELIGKPVYHFIHPEDREKFKQTSIKQNEIKTLTYRMLTKKGDRIWLETKIQRLSSSNSQSEEFICISRDITTKQLKLIKLEEEKRHLQQTIYLDELTGVYNRRFFSKLIDEQLNEFFTDQFEISLLMIDIDYFKQYNDTYGHLQGDQCLYIVASTIKKHVRESDLVCRIGGEEFCVVMPKTTKSEAMTIANSLCKKVESQKIAHSTSITSPYITISIGLSNVLKSKYTKLDILSLVHQADKALYKAKENGRNNVMDESLILQ